MWQPQLEALSADHHIALLDLPGYGLAQDLPVPDSLEGFSERVHQTLAQRFPGPVVIVGHSFGGYVALQLFRDHPEQFEALVLTNTRSEADAIEAKEKRLATVKRLEDPAQGLDVEETARALLSPATWEANGSVVASVRAMVRGASSRTIRGTLKAIADRPDLTPVLSTIHVPSLVIWGVEDRLIPPSQSRSMVGRIRGSSGMGIPGAAHLPSLEAPQLFGRALGQFLDRVGRD